MQLLYKYFITVASIFNESMKELRKTQSMFKRPVVAGSGQSKFLERLSYENHKTKTKLNTNADQNKCKDQLNRFIIHCLSAWKMERRRLIP